MSTMGFIVLPDSGALTTLKGVVDCIEIGPGRDVHGYQAILALEYRLAIATPFLHGLPRGLEIVHGQLGIQQETYSRVSTAFQYAIQREPAVVPAYGDDIVP